MAQMPYNPHQSILSYIAHKKKLNFQILFDLFIEV